MGEMRVGIGSSISRVDGRVKVTGQALYAAEYATPQDLLYGVVVSSAIARGKVTAIDERAARAVPGVVEIVSHNNRPRLAYLDRNYQDEVAPPGSPFRALYDAKVKYNGQPLALVLATSFEAARYAASLVRITYKAEPHNTDFTVALAEKFVPAKKRSGFHPPKNRGDAEAAYLDARVKIAAEFRMAAEHHNPMEMHATTVVWETADKITVYDKNQGSQNVQTYITKIFGLSADNVRVMNPFVGGAFGSGLRPQYNVYLAVMAAQMLKRSVKIVLTRQQMFSHTHRPEALQNIQLGSDAGGKLVAVINRATTTTSRFENYMEDIVIWGMINYACENALGESHIAPMDIYTTGDMRAPGAATGMTFFEMAMDELAYEAAIDPLQMRLINYSETDQMNETPFTSKALREAYAEGAAAFKWDKRSMAPRSMRDGRELVGWGMATGIWDAMFNPTSARARLTFDGKLEVATASSDIGTGTYTVMTQIAAGVLGLPIERIAARLGDSSLPTSPVEGGSWGAASVGAAVDLACQSVAEQLLKAAGRVEGTPLGWASMKKVDFIDGHIVLKSDPSIKVAFDVAMGAADLTVIEAEEKAGLGVGDLISMYRKSRNTHSAVFVEVKVDEQLGVVRVTRVVSAIAAGRIINPKTARSQILGGVVMGIGMALHEEAVTDHRSGRIMNSNFAEYHIPANADIGNIEVIFVDEPDAEVTPLGVKGLGEIGIVSTAAAVANAIFHATGKRQRNFPITIDKVFARERRGELRRG